MIFSLFVKVFVGVFTFLTSVGVATTSLAGGVETDSRITTFLELPQEKKKNKTIKRASPCHNVNGVFPFSEVEDSSL